VDGLKGLPQAIEAAEAALTEVEHRDPVAKYTAPAANR